MNDPVPARLTAPRRYTSHTLTLGVAVAAVCFSIALLAEVAGVEPGSGEMTDIAAILEGLSSVTPWAWAAMGAYAIVVTPVLGLLVTAWEYASISDRRTVLLALAVFFVLIGSAIIAVLR